MSQTRALGLIVLLIVAGAVAMALGTDKNDAPTPNDGRPDASSTPDFADETSGEQLDPSHSEESTTPETADRVAVTGDALAELPALIGRVVDEDGVPIPSARIRCGGGFDAAMGSRGFESLESFDIEAIAEQVRERAANQAEAMTDADGRFRIVPVVGTGQRVALSVRARGHRQLRRTTSRPSGDDVDLGELKLERGAVITGRVVDGGGSPVVGARVSRVDSRTANFFGGLEIEFPGSELMEEMRAAGGDLTDDRGQFELAYVAPGSLSLRAKHPDHPVATQDDLTVTAGQELSNVVIVVEPGAAIAGRVVGIPEGTKGLRVLAAVRTSENDRRGQGEGQAAILEMLGGAGGGEFAEMLGDAGLAVGQKSVKPAADGTFEMRGLPADKAYRIWVVQNGRGFATAARCSDRVEVLSGATGIELRYEAGITVTFQAVDSTSNEPVERLWVRDRFRGGRGGIGDLMAMMPQRGGGGGAKTFPEGRVTLANLRPKKDQKLQITLDALGFDRLQLGDIEVPESGAIDLGALRMNRVPTIEISVKAKRTGEPVAGARVRIEAPGQARSRNPMAAMMGRGGDRGPTSGRTDSDGRCVVNAVVGGEATVKVSQRGFAPYESSPQTWSGTANQRHEVALLVGGTVEVTVVDATGAPVSRAQIERRGPQEERGGERANSEGVAKFEHLPPGEHRFRIGRAGSRFGGFGRRRNTADETPWTTVIVEDEATATVQLAKDPTASLVGFVRENGVPLSGARITFVEGPATPAAQNTEDPARQLEAAMARFGGGRGRRARSDEDGAYQLKELPAGAHRLSISHRTRATPTVVEVFVREGQNTFDVNLTLTVVRGTVRGPDGSPIAGARVRAVPVGTGDAELQRASRMIQGAIPGLDIGRMSGNASAVTTDADGNYEIRGVAPGTLQVTAQAKGYASGVTSNLTIVAGAVVEGADATLRAAGSVTITMTNAPPFSAAQATLQGGDANGAAPIVRMLRRGKATLDGLAPGTWEIRIMGPGGNNPDPKTVEIVAGESASVAF